jgi:hypothetical protein
VPVKTPVPQFPPAGFKHSLRDKLLGDGSHGVALFGSVPPRSTVPGDKVREEKVSLFFFLLFSPSFFLFRC